MNCLYLCITSAVETLHMHQTLQQVDTVLKEKGHIAPDLPNRVKNINHRHIWAFPKYDSQMCLFHWVMSQAWLQNVSLPLGRSRPDLIQGSCRPESTGGAKFTVHMPLLTTASKLKLRRHQSSPQECYWHCPLTVTPSLYHEYDSDVPVKNKKNNKYLENRQTELQSLIFLTRQRPLLLVHETRSAVLPRAMSALEQTKAMSSLLHDTI